MELAQSIRRGHWEPVDRLFRLVSCIQYGVRAFRFPHYGSAHATLEMTSFIYGFTRVVAYDSLTQSFVTLCLQSLDCEMSTMNLKPEEERAIHVYSFAYNRLTNFYVIDLAESCSLKLNSGVFTFSSFRTYKAWTYQ
jgi:hypothetical protein